MTSPQPSPSGLTGIGKLFSTLLVLGLLVLGAYVVMKRFAPAGGQNNIAHNADDKTPAKFDTSDLTETATEVPHLGPAVTYVPQNNIIDVELSQYAGYAGLIVANNGLEPNDDSYFNKKYGFKLRIKISEEESWNSLNAGKMAASATTADVLPVYGRQFQVVVPAQISYSRGADGLVVRNDIKKVNDLKGKIVSAAQFTESDFFIRYLAKEAGIDVKMLPDLSAAPDPDAINLLFCKDGFAAGDFFLKALKADVKSVAGCVTWAPKTTEIPAESQGKARLLVSNKNLLIIADILVVNAGFAKASPDKVDALVDGLLMGNKTVRDNPDASADLLAKALSSPTSKWDRAKTLAELQKVHLSNLPEQLAFFSGGITQGGSFASIYQSSFLAYGTDLIPNPVGSERFLSLSSLNKADTSGTYKDQVAAIKPLSSGPSAAAETDPILSKDIRFFFDPNLATLDMSKPENVDNLKAIKRILDVSPGSRISLVGHVDNSKIPEFRTMGGDARVQQEALGALDLSKRRALEVVTQLVAREKVDPKRLETSGMGWTHPVSATNPDLNRRVEVQWFTLE